MRKLISLGLAMALLMAGCGSQPAKPAPVDVPVDSRQGPSDPSEPPSASSKAVVDAPGVFAMPPWPPNLITEAVPSGFRLGPFRNTYPLRWFDNGRLYLHLQLDRGSMLAFVDVRTDKVTVLASHENGMYYENAPVLAGQAVLFAYASSGDPGGLWLQSVGAQPRQVAATRQIAHVSPTGTTAIAYGRGGSGRFIDLRSGEAHDLDTPDLYAAPGLDAWSPDGAHYVTQAPRADAIPGFRFFDGAGHPSGSFYEPGHYSFYPTWSPTGRELAFLSIALNQRYPGHPEAVFEPVAAPRLGILDLSVGTTRYFELPGLIIGSRPVWSPDGRRLAVTVGKPGTTSGDILRTVVQAQQIVAVDLASGKLQILSNPAKPDVTIRPTAWSPGGTVLAVGMHDDDSANERYALLRSPASVPVPLPGAPHWLSEAQLAVVTNLPDRLLLMNVEGKVLRQLAQGQLVRYPTSSPDGRYLAYTVDTLPGGVRLASDPPAEYVEVLDVTALSSSGAP